MRERFIGPPPPRVDPRFRHLSCSRLSQLPRCGRPVYACIADDRTLAGPPGWATLGIYNISYTMYVLLSRRMGELRNPELGGRESALISLLYVVVQL